MTNPTTACTAVTRPWTPENNWEMLCGSPAAAPHPDTELSYRQPLCLRHLAEVVARYCTRCAFMQRTDAHAICPTHHPGPVAPRQTASEAFRNAIPPAPWTRDLSSRLFPTRAW